MGLRLIGGSTPSLPVVTVVQLVEHEVVILNVVGSSPISHLALVCSTTVVHSAVNGTVTGSNPVRPVGSWLSWQSIRLISERSRVRLPPVLFTESSAVW